MAISKEQLAEMLKNDAFPLSAKYDPEWVIENQMGPAPDGSRWWDPAECSCFHTAPWWRRLWEQTELVEIEHADLQPDGWRDWLQFENVKTAAGKNPYPNEGLMVEADAGRTLGFVRMVGRRGGAT
jgi:hypothetical protein